MAFRLTFEQLEARDNPVGPVLVDPIGVPVATDPPATVSPDAPPADPSTDPTATAPAAPAPGGHHHHHHEGKDGKDGTDPTQKILDATLAAIGQTW